MDDSPDGMEACSNCLHLKKQIAGVFRRNQMLRRTVLRQRVKIQELEARLAKFEDRLRELEGPARASAANSSLPPSANPIGGPSAVIKNRKGGIGKGDIPALSRSSVDTPEDHQVVSDDPQHQFA